MEIIKYPDGTSYANIDIQERNITFKLNSYEDLWHLNQVVDAINKLGGTPTITIPNLIDAQADRRFSPHQSFGLKLVLKHLMQMKAHFRIFHPHNAEVVEMAFEICDKSVEIIDNSMFITRVLPKLQDERHLARLKDEYFVTKQGFNIDKRITDNLILMSSDAGGFKPLMKLCDAIGWQGTTESASKSRKDGKVDEQKVPLEDFNGKDILIIDDICIYGGTFKGLAKLLRERNCGKLYLAVSHMTVQDLGLDPVTDYFDKVFTTNSKYDEYVYGIDDDGTPLNYIPNNLEIIKMF